MKQPPPLPPHIVPGPTSQKPQSGAMKKPSAQLSLRLPQSGFGAWLVRLALLLLCAGSCWLLYWSFASRLQPVNREHQQKTIEMSRLADEVEQMRLKLDRNERNQIEARYKSAQQFLFANPKDLSEWEDQVKIQGGSMRLDVMCQLGEFEPHPRAREKLGLIKAQLGIQPAYIPGATNSPFRQLLSFTQNMAKSSKRFDLLELSVEGDTNSVKQALAVVQLWSEEGKSK
jgi:hypothetical protein